MLISSLLKEPTACTEHCVDMASADLVHLNVGGVLYTTTKATLSRYPNSMIGVMFNGSMPTSCDENGRYFIDRDGNLFGHVLNFLRSSQLALPDDFKQHDQLAVEADFYQIEPLIHALDGHRQKLHNDAHPVGNIIEVIEVRTGSTATMPTNNSRVKTILSGRRDILNRLPGAFIQTMVAEKLHHTGDMEFAELEMNGSNVRLRLAEYLQCSGWTLLNSNLSSSSGYDSKSMISSLIIEQSYRDRWFKEADISDISDISSPNAVITSTHTNSFYQNHHSNHQQHHSPHPQGGTF